MNSNCDCCSCDPASMIAVNSSCYPAVTAVSSSCSDPEAAAEAGLLLVEKWLVGNSAVVLRMSMKCLEVVWVLEL